MLQNADVKHLISSKMINISGMFDGCISLVSMDLTGVDTTNVTDMSNLFKNCKALTSVQGIENLNVNRVRNMDCMFYGCENLNSLNLSAWVTSTSLTSMKGMFYKCTKLTSLNLSGFNVSNVTDLVYENNGKYYGLFGYCSALTEVIGIENWNTGKMVNIRNLFRQL
jgi:surface protein